MWQGGLKPQFPCHSERSASGGESRNLLWKFSNVAFRYSIQDSSTRSSYLRHDSFGRNHRQWRLYATPIVIPGNPDKPRTVSFRASPASRGIFYGNSKILLSGTLHRILLPRVRVPDTTLKFFREVKMASRLILPLSNDKFCTVEREMWTSPLILKSEF